MWEVVADVLLTVSVHLHSQTSQILGADLCSGFVLCWMVMYPEFRKGSSVILSTPEVTTLGFFNLYEYF